jgi:TatD DNase family protein
MHFFSGNLEEARALTDLGFYFTFGGVITFSHDYDEVVRNIPLERILTETDAPYVAPVPHRGKRNEPSFVLEVEKQIALLRNMSIGRLTSQIMMNAEEVFSISFHS